MINNYLEIRSSDVISECLISPPVLPVQETATTEIKATTINEYLNQGGISAFVLKNLKAAAAEIPSNSIVMREI